CFVNITIPLVPLSKRVTICGIVCSSFLFIWYSTASTKLLCGCSLEGAVLMIAGLDTIINHSSSYNIFNVISQGSKLMLGVSFGKHTSTLSPCSNTFLTVACSPLTNKAPFFLMALKLFFDISLSYKNFFNIIVDVALYCKVFIC